MPTYIITVINRTYETYSIYRVESAANVAEEKLAVSDDFSEEDGDRIEDILMVRPDELPEEYRADEIELLVRHDIPIQ